jgi:ATP:corrinoid adenosyltransferase
MNDEPAAELRHVEHLRLRAAEAARLAERRRMIRLGAWVATFIAIVGLAEAWIANRWALLLVVAVAAYVSLRLLHRRESMAAVLTRPARTAVVVTGAVSLASLVPLHFLVVDRFAGDSLGAVAGTAVAVFGVWALSAWWTTR